MAKVYEALRRAEEERKRRAGDQVTPVAPLEFETDVAPAPRKQSRKQSRRQKPRKSLGKRLLAAPMWFISLPTRMISGISARVFTRTQKNRRMTQDASDVNKRRISILQPDSYVAEQFRALRGRIDAVAAKHPLRTIVVTSAFPAEGKTTSAVNLAAVTALSLGRRVLLIDCDLRKPKVHHALGLRPSAGLAEVLLDQTSLDQAIMKVEGANLEVLAVRGKPANPSELLGSDRMRELIAEVAERYDRVILDSPAALGLPDAKCIADLSDGVVMIVRADSTTQQDIHAVLDLVDRRRVIGMVLNGAQVDQGRYGYAS